MLPSFFFDRVYYREVLRRAAPVFIGMASVTLIINVDMLFIGKLGKEKVVAAGLGNWIYWAIWFTLAAVETGVRVIVSRRYGERNYQDCGHTVDLALIFSLLSGTAALLLFHQLAPWIIKSRSAEVTPYALEYFRYKMLCLPFAISLFALFGFYYGIGKNTVPMATDVLVNVLNVVLDYVLIFGHLGLPALGVKGAALASSLSISTGFFLLLIYTKLYRRRGEFHLLRFKQLRKSTLMTLLRVSYPVGLQHGLADVCFYVFLIINDRIGVKEAAATNLAFAIYSFSWLPAFGFGIAASTLVSQKLGERKPRDAERFALVSMAQAFVAMSLLGLFYAVLGPKFLTLYIKDPEVIEVAKVVMLMLGLMQLPDSFAIVGAMTLQGAGLTRYVMVWDVVVHWLVFLPLAYLLGLQLGLGATGTWLAVLCYVVMLAAVFLQKFFRGEWQRVKV